MKTILREPKPHGKGKSAPAIAKSFHEITDTIRTVRMDRIIHQRREVYR